MTKIEEFKQKQAEDLENLIACEALREKLTALDPRLSDVSIFKSDLYGIDFWVTIESSLVGISEMAHAIDQLPDVPMVLTRSGGTSFKTKAFLDGLSEDQAIAHKPNNILPLTVKVESAPFCRMYTVNAFKMVDMKVVKFSLETDSRIEGVAIKKTYNKKTLIDVQLATNGALHDLFDEDGEAIAGLGKITWWASRLGERSWTLYWTPYADGVGYSTHKLLHLMNQAF